MGICFRNPEAFIEKKKKKKPIVTIILCLCVHLKKKKKNKDFPDGPVPKIHASNAEFLGSIHDQEMDIPHATWCSQKIKNKLKKELVTDHLFCVAD